MEVCLTTPAPHAVRNRCRFQEISGYGSRHREPSYGGSRPWPIDHLAATGLSQNVIVHAATELGSFDFIHAAGLDDCLSDRVGVRLINTLFSILKPGGKVWIVNFVPDIDDAGFLEAIMD
ncbi:MAG: hypothetical protein ACK5UT_12310 [Acidobacteriota bacterium]|jgi:hypothetical protein